MSMENVVAVQIPPAELKKMQAKVKELTELIGPYLISLTAQQRKEVLAMGDSSEPFVAKSLDYAKSNPEFLPGYNKLEDFEIDYTAVKDLTTLVRPLNQLTANLNDTHLMSGAEAYRAARNYYESVKVAAKNNASGAKVISEDLGKRFAGQGKKAKAA
ncbi:hypothetical protein [uncultured Imperialibacter sp.]|uniref:hypothetical protein n=1 Tax=uncultured Imperialibacter sp. TaxID=1672639 RepID=UPI0030D982A2